MRSSLADETGKACPPQLGSDEWREVLDELFDSDTRAVLMTDSAPCFVGVEHCGIVDKHHVNHSAGEFIRSVEVIADAASLERRPGMAGTQMIDREWGWLKSEVTMQGVDVSSESGRRHLATNIRAAQFKRMCGTHDRWPQYCLAVGRMRGRHGSLPPRQWPKRRASPDDARRHVDGACGEFCGEPAHVCCVACSVPLCAQHFGPCSGSTSSPLSQSRCHEHAIDEAAKFVCPCSDCKTARASLVILDK